MKTTAKKLGKAQREALARKLWAESKKRGWKLGRDGENWVKVTPGKGKKVTVRFLEQMNLCLEELAAMVDEGSKGRGARDEGKKKAPTIHVERVVADKGLPLTEAGLLVARPCSLLEAGWVCVFDRRKGGPVEFEGAKGFELSQTKRFVVLYRAAPDESRTWKQPGKWVGTEDLGEARRWAEVIAAGDDKHGVLPVPDPGVMAGLNQRQFLYCQYRLDGKTQAEAFTLAGYKAKDAYAGASEVEANPKVSQYLASKRTAVEAKFEMSRDELLLWHKRVMDTPIGDIDEKHSLCQEYKVTGGEIASVSYKMPPKMEAAKEIKVIMGWDKSEKEKEKREADVEAIATVLRGMVQAASKGGQGA